MNTQQSLDVDIASTIDQSRTLQWVKALGVGAFLGSAWGTSLRAWMTILALEFGDYPVFTWDGTFLMIVLPSTLMGLLLGGANYAAYIRGNKRWRWAAISPILLVIGPLIFMPDFIPTLLEEGLGGGAIAVALVGLFGGYGLSSLGKRWLRGLLLLLALIVTCATPYALFFADNLGRLTARQMFGALHFITLMILLMVATNLPYRIQTNQTT
jgi:hypothetical protein